MTSKWNKTEHRLFSFISMNWRGKTLIDYQTIVNLIAATKTETGLTVKVRLDTRRYEKGIKVSKKEPGLFFQSFRSFHFKGLAYHLFCINLHFLPIFHKIGPQWSRDIGR